MTSGLLIISVYRPDVHEDAVREVGVARDVVVVRDRRVGERRRMQRTPGLNDRRRLAIDDQLQCDGWVFVSAEERQALARAVASAPRP
jgi:hypothetical protein